MPNRSKIWNRAALVIGWLGLAIALLLTPLGVRAVRAGDVPATSSEVCPLPAETGGPAGVAPSPPAARAPGVDEAARGGNPEPIDLDEFVPLNTQGYNYRDESAPTR